MLEIIFEDSDLLVVNKPAGLLTTPGRFIKDCVISQVNAYRDDARVVHRLDLDTSGLIVMGCTKAGVAGLNRLFRERRITKTYEAIVAGVPKPSEHEITYPLGPDRLHRPRQKVVWRGGKRALTRFEVREQTELGARILVEPVTGVRHQLRCHLALVGHPILGCDLYAPPIMARASKRLMLHATRLAFEHPISGSRLSLYAQPEF